MFRLTTVLYGDNPEKMCAYWLSYVFAVVAYHNFRGPNLLGNQNDLGSLFYR